jgi:hypothetical protein
MDETAPETVIDRIGHFGILSAMAKRIKLVKIINDLLSKTSKEVFQNKLNNSV